MKRAIVHFESVCGAVRPQHCLSYAFRGGRRYIDSLHEALGESELYTRIQGNAVSYGKSVDIPYIFRNFDADANDPASYYFPQTDSVMHDASTYAKHIIYTLCAPRELRAPRIYCTVPKDFEKWADVCVNIIRHYTKGLWDGFTYPIDRFEIWNEPDNPVFWEGTPEEYCRLYEITARKIKALDPAFKVGGPSLSLFEEKGFAFAKYFLDYVKSHDVPLDFFSFHSCDTDPNAVAYRVSRVSSLLSDYGKPVEVFQTAWACVDEKGDERTRFDNLRNAQGAAYASAVMSILQNSNTSASVSNVATICDAINTGSQYGAFLGWYGEWQKPFYALLAYKVLYELGTEVRSEGYGLYVTAATDNGGKGAVLVTNFDGKTERAEILVTGRKSFRATYRILDETRDLATVKIEEYRDGNEYVLAAELRGYTTLLIELEDI